MTDICVPVIACLFVCCELLCKLVVICSIYVFSYMYKEVDMNFLKPF